MCGAGAIVELQVAGARQATPRTAYGCAGRGAGGRRLPRGRRDSRTVRLHPRRHVVVRVRQPGRDGGRLPQQAARERASRPRALCAEGACPHATGRQVEEAHRPVGHQVRQAARGHDAVPALVAAQRHGRLIRLQDEEAGVRGRRRGDQVARRALMRL